MRGDPVEPPFGCKPLEAQPGDKVRVTFEAAVAKYASPGHIRPIALEKAVSLWDAKIEVIEKAPPPPPQVGDRVRCKDMPDRVGVIQAINDGRAWLHINSVRYTTEVLGNLERVS